jgi:hypothetical protein
VLRILSQIVRNLFARERLDEAPAEVETVPARRAGPALVSMLFAPEPLPLDPESPPRVHRGGLAAALFAREPLPEDPPAPPRGRRGRWLRWLAAPERLDPPP